MANIKFSAFTQKVASADVDFLVGYTGGDNVRITPSVFDDRYVPLAGGTMTGNLRINDGVRFQAGSSGDFNIRHNGVATFQENETGDLNISNYADDKDIIFYNDDGAGSVTEYLRLDGSSTNMKASKDIRFIDNVDAEFGTGGDFKIYHDGVDTFQENETGDLNITQNADNKNIIFKSDNGSGSTATYITVDGANIRTKFSKNTIHLDSIKANFGNGSDLQIYHDSGNNYIQGVSGDMYIQNGADDKDIIFRSDDGAGGQTEYFRLDGGIVRTIFSKNIGFEDDVKAIFGAGNDLQIYHDGSNSIIKDSGAGNLVINAGSLVVSNAADTQNILIGIDGAEVRLYHNGSKKFETTSTGVKITGVSEFADNTAAIAGGLTTGDVYRTGDLLKIVH